MRQEGNFVVHAPVEKAWEFFLDPPRLLSAIGDPHRVEVEDADHFRFEVRPRVGFLRGTFRGSATVTEREVPRRFRVAAHASGPGSGLDVESVVAFAEEQGSTRITWEAEVVLRGSLAGAAARLFPGIVEKKLGQFFANVRRRLEKSR